MKLSALYGRIIGRKPPPPPPERLRGEIFVVLHPASTDPRPFTELLSAHPAVICHHGPEGPFSASGFAGLSEGFLAKARASGELASFRQAYPDAYLYKYVFDSRGRQAAGFVMDQSALLGSLNAPLRNVVMQDRDVRVILYAARNTLYSHVEGLYREQGTAVSVDPKAFLLHAHQTDRMNEYVERLFHPHRKLKLDMDELLSAKREAALQGVASFLSLDAFPDMADVAARPTLDAMLSNAPALQAALQDTPYAWMLEPAA